MGRDVKIGMLAGLVLVSVAVFWLSRDTATPNNLEDPGSENPAVRRPAEPYTAAPDSQTHLPDAEFREPNPVKTTRFHIVRPGQTLSDIARQYYSSPDQWRRILRANPQIENPDLLTPGMKLTIPD